MAAHSESKPMIIVNADDWGRSVAETDAALACHLNRRITSVTAMAFMPDSDRAAELAMTHGIETGLHLNFSQPFSAGATPARVAARQERVCSFINAHKYAFLLYNPMLRRDFFYTYQAQIDEFYRLYRRLPSHVDGHHHKHLCGNVLLDDVIPAGMKLRRNFFFWPGEKGYVNRAYRKLTDHLLGRRYRLTDYFFALSQCLQDDRLRKVLQLARTHCVEVMTHPASVAERECLMSDGYMSLLTPLEPGTYSSL